MARNASIPLAWKVSQAPRCSAPAGSRSYTVQSMPTRCSAIASVGPATPPPMISACVISNSSRVSSNMIC